MSAELTQPVTRGVCRCCAAGLQTLAVLWLHFVARIRKYWEDEEEIPLVFTEDQLAAPTSGSEGGVGLGWCLLYQKLQVLQVCIRQRRETRARHNAGASSSIYDSAVAEPHAADGWDINLSMDDEAPCHDAGPPTTSADSTPTELNGEKFFDAASGSDVESNGLKASSPRAADTSGTTADRPEAARSDVTAIPEAEGRGRAARLPGQVLLRTGDPLYVPVCARAPPKTEDSLMEEQVMLARLGGTAQASRVRQKLQTLQLKSDMSAFKVRLAARPV